jgi:large subunit ribosomal protein L35
MPKMKTIKAARKRFKKTAKGKIMHYHAGKGHLLQNKSRKQKRAMSRWDSLDNPRLMKKYGPSLD